MCPTMPHWFDVPHSNRLCPTVLLKSCKSCIFWYDKTIFILSVYIITWTTLIMLQNSGIFLSIIDYRLILRGHPVIEYWKKYWKRILWPKKHYNRCITSHYHCFVKIFFFYIMRMVASGDYVIHVWYTIKNAIEYCMISSSSLFPQNLREVPSNLADSPSKSANSEGIVQIWRIPPDLNEIVINPSILAELLDYV